jgi:D-alanyl-lipoteichoic acid acyltransferase DltB (MBOAT superfamily)
LRAAAVLFNSYEYLCYFLPAAIVGYFLLARSVAGATLWLVAASLFFYAWWDVRNLPLILASIAVNFVVGRRLQAGAGRGLLAVGVAANLVALGVFKYAAFFTQNVAAITGLPLPVVRIELPLGISFFTFTQIAYLVDCHRRRATEPSLPQYALFVSFFPHLISGPILHHAEMMPQFASPTNKAPRWDNLSAGLFLLAIGLCKKVLVADNLAPIADAGFGHAGALSVAGAWTAALAYALQIYFDFSGYTDMALGAARMFNIRMPINFDSPYRALSLRDFWRRWHMTLSRFLRDYLYVPLGGDRGGFGRTIANLMVTFVLGGLWHGAAWTFVAWGALHGMGMVVVRAWQRAGLRLPVALAWAVTFAFVLVTWVFFRATSMADAMAMVRAMSGLGTDAGAVPSSADLRLLAAAFAITLLPLNSNALTERFTPALWRAVTVGVAVFACLLQLGKVTPFLYFNF